MTLARLQRIEEIFNAALDQDPDQIAGFLDKACGGDEVLRRKVETLLASHQRAGTFIETSAVGIATRIIENGQADLLIGQTFGHYKISKRIGVGGMGEVFLATDVTAGRKAALKLLPVRFTGNAERLKRFQQEARAVVALNHPNIVTVYEIGEDQATHYIASELIEGETLRQRLKRGRMEMSEAVDIAIQVASGLGAAHEAGIVHRDINPGNIMLRPDGYVKVLDFGIAKLAEQEAPAAMPKDEALLPATTNLGSILGTVPYMSPEQAHGAPVDQRTDIWSLGVVVYEMVTGHEPFTGDTPRKVMTSILEKEQPPLTSYIKDAPYELRQIISKTLRKDRRERCQTAGEILEALKDLRRKLELKSELEHSTTAPSWLRRRGALTSAALLLLVFALVVAIPFYRHRGVAPSSTPDKSIAVLPFENLSKDEENAFFAGGVQDEILTDLARIADLKVISRTSVMRYKSGPERNLRQIAEALGVSHVLEGSVQRTGERVRVSAQLIDAHSDAHLWAEHYDRDVADVFSIQTEIAQQIADQLEARLSPAEKAAIAERPTTDPVAYAYYTKAKEMDMLTNWEGDEKNLNQKVELLEKATQRDPNFALAYCALAKAQGDLYFTIWDPKHLELAKKAAEAAVRARPDLGETHLALAGYYFHAGFSAAGQASGGINTGNFDRARKELTIADRKLPNNSEALFMAAKIDRRQNRWDSALATLQKARELDPRNGEVAYTLAETYFEMRRYQEVKKHITKDVANWPEGEPWTQLWLAQIKLAQGDPVGAHALLEQVPLDFSPSDDIWEIRFLAALYLHDCDAADRVIAATPAKWAEEVFAGQPPDSWADGQIARARGDKEKALAVFAAARKKLDATWGERPRDEIYFEQAADFDAGLGRKEDAIREALHAVELTPLTKDSLLGPPLATNLALVYAWTAELGRALEQLEIVAKIPAGPTYGDLRFNPCWDNLRGDPRFDKILAAAKAASK